MVTPGAHHGGCLAPLFLVGLAMATLAAAIHDGAVPLWTAAAAGAAGLVYLPCDLLLSSPRFQAARAAAPRPRAADRLVPALWLGSLGVLTSALVWAVLTLLGVA